MSESETNLMDALHEILGKIEQDQFGGRAAPKVSVSEGTDVNDAGELSGTIVVRIQRRDGSFAVINETPLDKVTTLTGLHDAFAESLSKVLAEHHSWPK